METIIYEVPNISCNHCVHTIKMELAELSGVISVDADATSKKVVISYGPPATKDVIERLLAEINYPVKK